MSSTLTIDLDSLSAEGAQRIAAMILTYAAMEVTDEVRASDIVKVEIQPSKSDFDPKAAFSDSTLATSDLACDYHYELPAESKASSLAGPQLVIPNPPQAEVAAVVGQIIPPAGASASGVTGSTQLDSAGMPHDPRIHSKEKTFTKEGVWRVRRGLPDGYLEQIEAENKKLMAIPIPALTVTASAPLLPPPPPSPAAVINDPAAFVNLATKVTSAIGAQKITAAQVQKVAESVGLQTFMQLAIRQDLVPTVDPLINALLAGNAV